MQNGLNGRNPMILGHERTLLAHLMEFEEPAVDLSFLHHGYPTSEPHRRVFDAVCELRAGGQRPVAPAVCDELQKRGDLDRVGGIGEVTSIAMGTSVPAVTDYAASVVREQYSHTEAYRLAELVKKGDLDAASAARAFQSIANETQPDHGLSVRSVREIVELAVDEHDCLMGDRLIPKGQSIVIAGPGGIGKSRMLLQLAAAYITGRQWCGFDTHAKDQRWLVVQTKNNVRRLQFDLSAIQRWLGPEDWERVCDALFIKTLENNRNGFVELADPQNCVRLTRLVKQVAPQVIAFDPLRDFKYAEASQPAKAHSEGAA